MRSAPCPVCGFAHAPDELFVQDGYDDHGDPLFEPTCALRPAWEAARSAPQPPGSFAYHATPRYQEALRNGLLPLSGSCKHVALAATPGIASAVPDVRQISEPWEVLRVDTSGLTLFMELGEARYHGVIPPDRLSVVEPRPAPDFTGWSDPSYRVNHTDCLVANGRDPSIRRRLLREAWTEAQRRYDWPSDEQYASIIDELRTNRVKRPLRVTLDTGALHPKTLVRIGTAIADQDVELDHTTVNARERPYPPPQPAGLPELLVLDESRVGEAVVAGEEDAALFEAILEVISDRGFPPPGGRDDLSAGQLHQLRDAMTLEAHSRSGRDVFVTTDLKGFIKHGRREKLEELCSTTIVTIDEFVDQLDALITAARSRSSA